MGRSTAGGGIGETGNTRQDGMGALAWPRRSGAREEWDLPFQPVIDFGRAESRPRRATTGKARWGFDKHG
jgi:hypothetical protein